MGQLHHFRSLDPCFCHPADPQPCFCVAPQTDQAMITAISCVPSSDQAFLSAGRSGEVLVWQITTPNKPAATLLPPAPTDGGADPGNASVITCLEVLGHLVLAGTYGQGTNVWNLRWGLSVWRGGGGSQGSDVLDVQNARQGLCVVIRGGGRLLPGQVHLNLRWRLSV